MDCQNLNESTYNKIQNVLEASKTEKILKDHTYFQSTYGSATLINNWFENRTNEQNIKINTDDFVTEYMDSYRQMCISSFPDRKEYFNKIFEGLGYGQELLIDHLGFSYYDNYVSTYDLCFNHLTKGICGPIPRHYFKGDYKPATDLSLIYGNLTQWGLKEKIYKKVMEELESHEDLTTENKSEYVLYKESEVRKLNDFHSFKKRKAIY